MLRRNSLQSQKPWRPSPDGQPLMQHSRRSQGQAGQPRRDSTSKASAARTLPTSLPPPPGGPVLPRGAFLPRRAKRTRAALRR